MVAFENATCSISVAVVPLGINGSVPTFKCFAGGSCVEAAGGVGLKECRQACVPAGSGWKCANQTCVPEPGGISKTDCTVVCVPGGGVGGR